jgi:hypothetical protein
MTKIRGLQPPPIKFGAQSGACGKPGLASGPFCTNGLGGPYFIQVGFRLTPRILLTARGKICSNPPNFSLHNNMAARWKLRIIFPTHNLVLPLQELSLRSR